MNYETFLQTKTKTHIQTGIEVNQYNPLLMPFQQFIVERALKAGKYAIFADCGLGKSFMQLEWANHVLNHTNKSVLIVAPLAVSGQTCLEASKFNLKCEKYTGQQEVGVYITNYEQIHKINASEFGGIVLDESSMIKNFSGSYRNTIITNFANTPFKLACTATPSPNDELELGNHAEFLNVMTSQDMRSIYFTTDKELIKTENKYRLKKHAEKEFYRWVSSWAIMISKPSDIGFNSDGYSLPPLNFIQKTIITQKKDNGKLFNDNAVSATDFNKELRITKVERLSQAIEIINATEDQFIVWVKQNEEGDYLKDKINGMVEVRGSEDPEEKEKKLLAFARGEYRVLVTKQQIAKYGLNFQSCHNQFFVAPDFSFEGLYQAIRRSYRYGQKHQVNIYITTTDTMQNVIDSIKEKEEKFVKMQDEMREAILANIEHKEVEKDREVFETDEYKLILGDCVEEVSKLADESIDYSFFSPPFGALYVFSNDPKDMSNVKNNDEFLVHFKFLVKELLRVLKSGRLVSIHMMQSTTLLGRDGFYSIVDFRGDIIRLFQECGFIFHAENMIRKDPKTAAIRTKNRQLMHGTTKIDSSIVRPGLADYILTFKKKGENQVPIQNNVPFELWCKIAEPVWIDVNEGDTLDYRAARDNNDERHITPTQLQPIEWCYHMWVNKGETVLSPFSGIASEGYQAVSMGRKYIGIELKKSYFDLSKKNLASAVQSKAQTTLF